MFFSFGPKKSGACAGEGGVYNPVLMRGRVLGLSILIVAFSAGAALARPAAEAGPVWQFQNGHWSEIPAAEAATTQPAPDPELVQIEQMVINGQYESARQLCVDWLKANHGSPLYDRALFLQAQALYGVGKRIKAFYYLDELMDEYPSSSLYYQALQRQYDIADAYLSGYRDKLFGLHILDRNDEAIEMLYRIQQRSPGSPLAEKALLRTADFYYGDGQFDLAVDAYGAYARDFPRSAILPRILLRQAFANLAQFRGLRYDATPVIDAQAQLEQLVALYPSFAADEKVPDVLLRIDHTFARKLLVTAAVYRRIHEPGGAAYTYKFLLRTYPDLPEAQQARGDLKQLPAWAQATREPAPGPVAEPTTQPVGNTPPNRQSQEDQP
jgi:outer membrane protein assembly factor BamD (BamD/ComL family)